MKTKPKKRAVAQHTPAQFIVIWQTAQTKADALRQLKTGEHNATARAKFYRSKGVKLRYFRDPASFDWAHLRKLAIKLTPKTEAK